MTRFFASALLASVVFASPVFAANTIDNHTGITPPVAVGDEMLLWDVGSSATVKATITQLFAIAGVGGDCSGTGGPVVSVVCSLAASKITSGTLAAARLPNPTATTIGGVESIAPVSHQWVTSISTSGVPSLAQPSVADLSDGSLTMTGAEVGNAMRNGNPPTVTSCGTSPTVGTGSTDYSGTINVGTGTVTACSVTFAVSHSPALRCWVQPSSGTPVSDATNMSTTTLAVVFSASLGAGRFDYGCN
jgi:hypothetical protein